VASTRRSVQQYPVADREAFMALEAEFAEMERRREDWPSGRRYRPVSGREPVHTLIWEHEFATLVEAHEALARMAGDPGHDDLFRRQAPYITSSCAEIYETLDL
jgi:hypothetical protein